MDKDGKMGPSSSVASARVSVGTKRLVFERSRPRSSRRARTYELRNHSASNRSCQLLRLVTTIRPKQARGGPILWVRSLRRRHPPPGGKGLLVAIVKARRMVEAR